MPQVIDVPGHGLVEFPDGMSDADIVKAIQANTKQEVQPHVLDAPNAYAAGVNEGVVRLAGIPGDTLANVIDLAKIPFGVGYTEATGKAAPDWLAPSDRKSLPLTSDWMLDKARSTELGRMATVPANPEYIGGYINTAGVATPGAFVGSRGSAPQIANSAALNIGGATAGKFVYDETGDPTLTTLASLSVPASQLGGSALLKRMVRGGEQGRQNMAQRMTFLDKAGVSNPTLGLASGNELIGGAENLLQSTPGAIKIMRTARDAAISGMQNTTDDAASLAAGQRARGNTEAGASIRADIRGPFMERFKATQAELYSKLDRYIAAGDKVGVQATKQALDELTAIDQGAPNLSAGFVNGKIQDIRNRFEMDTGARPVGQQFLNSVPIRGQVPTRTNAMGLQEPAGPVVGQGGSQGSSFDIRGPAPTRTNAMGVTEVAGPIIDTRNTLSAPGASTNPLAAGAANFSAGAPKLPFGTLKKQRTEVGTQTENTLLSGAPDRQWKRLYAGMSEDMGNAATAAGPGAEKAWKRANDYTRSGMARLERVGSFADKDAAPEAIYTRLVKASESGTSTLQAVKKSLSQDTRGQVAGTLIEQLGKATNAQQNAAGDAWSPETFLTNWNKIKTGRSELLSGFKDADKVRAQIEAVAQATSMMRQSSKMWANPSGTGANTFARAVMFGTPASALIDPWLAIGAGLGLAGTNATARLLTNKAVVDSFANRTNFSVPTYAGLLTNQAIQAGLLDERQ